MIPMKKSHYFWDIFFNLQEAFDFWAAFTGLNNSKLYNNIDQGEHKLEQIFI